MKKFLDALKKLFASKPKTAPVVVVTPPVVTQPEQGELIPSENPAYNEAKKYEGKSESDSRFVAFMAGFWKIFGLNYKTIIGSSVAWCGLFIGAMNSQVGQKYIANGAGARNWAKYGQAIDWKQNGIPHGAVMHINHAGNCSSGDNNHVTFADGDCTPEELLKSNAVFPGFGGNQQNAVNRTMYSVKEICEVRWPLEIELPKKIVKSVNCSGKKTYASTTR